MVNKCFLSALYNAMQCNEKCVGLGKERDGELGNYVGMPTVVVLAIRGSSPPTNLNWSSFYFIFKILSPSLSIVLNFIFVT